MSKARKTVEVTQRITESVFNESFKGYAIATREAEKLNAEMNLKIEKLKSDYNERIQEAVGRADTAYEVIKQYADENRGDLFRHSKSVANVHGFFGYRMATPSLKLTAKNTWAKVLDCLRKQAPLYIRKKEEVDKDALIDDRAELGELFSEIGVVVSQQERFFVELEKVGGDD